MKEIQQQGHQINKRSQPFFQKTGSRDSFFAGAMIQPKLAMGQPGDIYEREADAMAEKVVNASPQVSSSQVGVQGKCAECDEAQESGPVLTKLQRMEGEEEELMQGKLQRMEGEEEELMQGKLQRMGAEEEELMQGKLQARLQMKSDTPEGFVNEEEMMLNQPTQLKGNGGSGQISDEFESTLSGQKGSGTPLPSEMQHEMGSAFGADFSNVRVHTNSTAVQMNQDINAQAFTHGSDVFFNSNKYDPDSNSGKKLLAHELTHVVQQGAA